MNIVLYNGNLKPPHFIKLLAKKLNEINHNVFIVGTSNRLFTQKNKNLRFITSDSNSQVVLGIHLVSTIIRFMILKPNLFFKILQIILKSKKRLRLKLKQFLIWSKLVLLNADIVHIQWASHVLLFEDILDEHFFKIVVSLRGRLVNVSPYVNDNLKSLYINNLPKIDGIHAVSNDILKNMSILGIKAQKLKVIYSGLDLEKIPNKTKYQKSSPLKIISVGRINWIKGYNYALIAIKELVLKGKDIHYKIIADGNTEELLYLIDDLGLKKHVTLISRLAHEEVLNEMVKSDILILPSVSEGLANVVLEAMAVGLPVISSNCGGMSEVIIDGENGWLFKNRNVLDLTLKIENFSAMNVEKIKAIAKVGKQQIAANYSQKLMCKQMIHFYNEL